MEAVALFETAQPRYEDDRDYASVLRTRRWTIVAVAAIVVAVALALTSQSTPMYVSKAVVLLRSTDDTSSTKNEPSMATETRLAGSMPVATKAAETVGGSVDPAAFREGLSLVVPLDTRIIEFHYSDTDALRAQARAEAFAEAYLGDRNERAVQELLTSTTSLERQIAELGDRAGTLAQQEASEADPVTKNALVRESELISSQLTVLHQRVSLLVLSGPSSGAELVERAALAPRASSPAYVRNGVVALLLGLVLGALAALGREAIDDGLRGSADVQHQLGAGVLSMIPRARRFRGKADGDLFGPIGVNTGGAEEFRWLGNNIALSLKRSRARSIVVTSCRANDAKTFTSANLGVALAKMGRRVIVVSACATNNQLERMFEIESNVGLVDVVAGDALLSAALRDTPVDRLRVLPAGSAIGSAADLLASPMMTTLLGELALWADVVLVDAAPLLAVADAAVLAATCDAVLVVIDGKTTTRSDLAEARQRLRQANASVLGAVVIAPNTGVWRD